MVEATGLKKLNKNRKMGIRLQNYYAGSVAAWINNNSTPPVYISWGVRKGLIRKEEVSYDPGWTRYIYIPNEVLRRLTK